VASNSLNDFVAGALRRQTEEQRDFLICSRDDIPNYYVQFPYPGEHPTTLCCEAISDIWLPPDLALGETGAAALLELGWTAPTTDASTRIQGWNATRKTWITTNWFQEFQLKDTDSYEAIAETLTKTLSSVYGFSSGRLRIELGPSIETPALIGRFDVADASETWATAEAPDATESPARCLTAEEMSAPAPPEYEWFSKLADIPGVAWEPPPELTASPEQHLRSARPVRDPDGYSSIGVAWVADDGTLIGGGYSRDKSAAEIALDARYRDDVEADEHVIVDAAAAALVLPGTRHDYHSALGSLADAETLEPEWIERALIADLQLILGNPAAALISPRWQYTGSLQSMAYSSIRRLMALYVNEGFLVDAERVEATIDALPGEPHPSYDHGRASRVIEALEALRT
jgi:hypothetical protein